MRRTHRLLKKPRGDAVLRKLPLEAQQRLMEWLLEHNCSYSEARRRCTLPPPAGLGMKRAPSLGQLSHYWASVCSPLLVQRRARAVMAADKLSRVTQGMEQIDQAFISQLKQMAFEVTLQQNPDPDVVSSIIGQALRLKDQELKEKQIDLQRHRFQRETAELFIKWSQDQQAREIASSAEPNSEKIERLGALMFPDTWKP